MRTKHYEFDNAKLRLWYSGHPAFEKPGICRTWDGFLKKLGIWAMWLFVLLAWIYFMGHVALFLHRHVVSVLEGWPCF